MNRGTDKLSSTATVFVCCIIRPHKKSGDNETFVYIFDSFRIRRVKLDLVVYQLLLTRPTDGITQEILRTDVNNLS